jgi:upstream activation factor subunit UAF30
MFMIRKTVVSQRRGAGLKFMKPVRPDDKLSRITGRGPLPFSEISRKVWEYIRRHELQDPDRKVIIHADDKLEPVFNGKRDVTIVEMLSLLAGHVAA